MKHKNIFVYLEKKILTGKGKIFTTSTFYSKNKRTKVSLLKKKVYEINFQNHRNFLKKKKECVVFDATLRSLSYNSALRRYWGKATAEGK